MLALSALALCALSACGGGPAPMARESASGGEAWSPAAADATEAESQTVAPMGAQAEGATLELGGAAEAPPLAEDAPSREGAGASAGTRRPVTPAAPIRPLIRDGVVRVPTEPLVLVPIVYEPRPVGPLPIQLAELSLRPGGTFRPPSGACQDVLIYVRAGELAAVGTGIAPPQAPLTLYGGDAVRFGPEGDGFVRNVGARTARTVIAAVRRQGEPRFDDPGPGAGEGCEAARDEDPLVIRARAASLRTSTPRVELAGALRVHVLLDEDRTGARAAGLSILEGEPDLVIPQHHHPGSAEILYVETGSGVMQIGERRVTLRAGAAIYVPPGVLHDLRADGTQPFRAVSLYSPSGPEQGAGG